MIAYTLNLDSLAKMTDEQFYQLCRENPEINFERNAKGEVIIMPPTGGETGNRNAELITEFGIWNREKKLGRVFDSSTCFKLPDGANRAPDVSWISLQRWNELTPAAREKFPPIVPDFVLELMSPSDRLENLREKMREYQGNGVKLAWLIDRKARRVEIYRSGREPEILDDPDYLSGEDVLPRFTLDLALVW